MNENAPNLHRRINLVMIVFGAAVLIINVIRAVFILRFSFAETVANFSIWSVAAVPVVLIVVHRMRRTVVGLVQIAVIILISVPAVIDEFDSFYGLGFMALAILLAFKYGFMNRAPRLKSIICIALIFALIEVSALSGDPEELGMSLAVIAFLLFFFTILFMVYRDDLDKISRRNKNLSDNLQQLYVEKARLSGLLNDKEGEIRKLEQNRGSDDSSDLDRLEGLRERFGLTRREFEITVVAYKTPMTNSEMADALCITTGTVKQHLNRIFEKLDVRSRTEMQFTVREFLG